MKTNLVLALMASTTLLAACGGFTSSVGPGQLKAFDKPEASPTPTQTEVTLAQLDGSVFDKIQDPKDVSGITSLALKLSGKQAPFQYEITMTPKDMPERTLPSNLVSAINTGDQKVFSILSQSVIVTIVENGNCVSLEVPNQNQTVFFRDVDTITAPIVLCK